MSEDGFTPVLKALVVDSSIARREMFRLKLNSVRHVLCKCTTNDENAVDIVAAAQTNCPEGNFDLIFCELVLPGADGCDVVQKIRASGFKGRIIGMLNVSDNVEKYGNHGAHLVVRRPVTPKQISILLADVDLTSGPDALPLGAHSDSSISIVTPTKAITDLTHKVITPSKSFGFARVDSARSMRASDAREDEDDGGTITDFQITSDKNNGNSDEVWGHLK
jgi:CheY-like chemotaxis protein